MAEFNSSKNTLNGALSNLRQGEIQEIENNNSLVLDISNLGLATYTEDLTILFPEDTNLFGVYAASFLIFPYIAFLEVLCNTPIG